MNLSKEDPRAVAYIKSKIKGEITKQMILNIDRETMWADPVSIRTMNEVIKLQNKLREEK